MRIEKNLKFLLSYVPGIMLLIFLVGCAKDPSGLKIIRLAGSSTITPVAAEAAEKFMQRYPHIKVTVSPGGSGVGVKSVGNGLIDIGMCSRNITKEERENFPNVDFKSYLIGRDAVAVVISSEIYNAGVTALSKEQLQGIYSGGINNWKDVGGPDKEILCIDKESHRGARHVFMEYVFGDEEALAKGADTVVGSNNETQSKVALSDAAIAMVSFAWINPDVRGVGIKAGEESIEPTSENLKNDAYPISRSLFLITKGTPTGMAQEYINFLLSREGQEIVEKHGFVSVP